MRTGSTTIHEKSVFYAKYSCSKGRVFPTWRDMSISPFIYCSIWFQILIVADFRFLLYLNLDIYKILSCITNYGPNIVFLIVFLVNFYLICIGRVKYPSHDWDADIVHGSVNLWCLIMNEWLIVGLIRPFYRKMNVAMIKCPSFSLPLRQMQYESLESAEVNYLRWSFKSFFVSDSF